MSDRGSDRKTISEHVSWCRAERDSRVWERAKYLARHPGIGAVSAEGQTLGLITHVAFLEQTIETLDRVIAAHTGRMSANRNGGSTD